MKSEIIMMDETFRKNESICASEKERMQQRKTVEKEGGGIQERIPLCLWHPGAQAELRQQAETREPWDEALQVRHSWSAWHTHTQLTYLYKPAIKTELDHLDRQAVSLAACYLIAIKPPYQVSSRNIALLCTHERGHANKGYLGRKMYSKPWFLLV